MKRIALIIASLVLVVSMLTACSTPAEPAEPEVVYTNPLQDARVRQALWYAIDWETITDTLWNGNVTAAPKSLVPEGEWQATGLTDYSYNPEKAKELLEAAKWDSEYVLKAVYYTGNLLDSITAIQAYWAEVGVKMEFQLLTDNLTVQLWTPPADKVNGPSEVDWDIAFAGTNALTLGEYYLRYHSTAANNSTIPYDAELDRLVDVIKTAVTTEDQKAAFSDMQKYLNEKVYTLPMFYLPSWIVTSDKLDMKGNEAGNDQFSYTKNILDWTIARDDKTMYTNTGAVSALEHTATNPGLFWHQEIVFDRLINASPELVPTDGSLAESYTVSEDGKSIEFVIRSNVKWHDGVDFTAEDVKWTLEYYPTIPGANALMTGVFGDIKAITVDGNKVNVEFNNVQPTALTIFSQWAILPKHKLENVDPALFSADTFWQSPIGTGPFKVEEVKLGQHTILSRNNDYFKPGTGNIEKIFMYPSTDQGDANLVTNALAGTIDYAFVKDSAQVDQIRALPNYTVDTVNVTFTRYAFINMFPRKE